MTLETVKKKVIEQLKEHHRVHSNRGESLWFLKQDAKAIKRLEKRY